MLQKLHISNYAIIKELQIDFSPQLNIITGETGAGKSILMGALNLILGQRADVAVLQNKAEKCVVEAYFKTSKSDGLTAFFDSNDLDGSEEVLVRREIGTNGKSRAFINDTPVNIGQLKILGKLMVDLHQQFDTLELGDEDFQRNVLDALAANKPLLTNLKQSYSSYQSSKSVLDKLVAEKEQAQKVQDYNQFLFDELQELNLQPAELETLEDELKLLNNAEQIKQQLSTVYFTLKDADQPIVQQIKVLQHMLQSAVPYHHALPILQERLGSAVIEILDVAEELESIDAGIHFDADRIQIANERMAEGYKMLKKHNVSNTDALLSVKRALEEKLLYVNTIDTQINELQEATKGLFTKCEAIADAITQNRIAEINPTTTKLKALLIQVGMPNAAVKIEILPAKLSAHGANEIQFLFDANNSDRFEPLHKVASGGELSRLMLAIKSLVAKKLELPTLIFDEIDTGISGEAARQVGNIMKQLAAAHQLIVISHQPQIAARADAHYFVYKQQQNNYLQTAVKLLSKSERVNAIAQMIGGERPGVAAIENAKEMLLLV